MRNIEYGEVLQEEYADRNRKKFIDEIFIDNVLGGSNLYY